MNDISVILSKIDEDAKAQAAAILAAGEENCAKLAADYQKEAEQERKTILAAGRANADAVLLRANSQSGIEERNLKLEARRAAIDAAFEKAMEKLCAMSDEKKVALYTELALESITGNAELVLNASEKASIGKAVVALVGKKLVADGIGNVVEAITNLKLPSKELGRVITLSEQVGAFRGGFMIREGNIETNCTFEVLVSGAKEAMEPDVARMLFS